MQFVPPTVGMQLHQWVLSEHDVYFLKLFRKIGYSSYVLVKLLEDPYSKIGIGIGMHYDVGQP